MDQRTKLARDIRQARNIIRRTRTGEDTSSACTTNRLMRNRAKLSLDDMKHQARLLGRLKGS